MATISASILCRCGHNSPRKQTTSVQNLSPSSSSSRHLSWKICTRGYCNTRHPSLEAPSPWESPWSGLHLRESPPSADPSSGRGLRNIPNSYESRFDHMANFTLVCAMSTCQSPRTLASKQTLLSEIQAFPKNLQTCAIHQAKRQSSITTRVLWDHTSALRPSSLFNQCPRCKSC